MRIVGGEWRGRALAGLGKGDPSAHLRPTTDRVRESLFNILEHGAIDDPITDARVLDVFAGTGALGLEALSRGAEHATFIENGRIGARLITDNIDRTGAGSRAQLIRRDATRPGPPTGAPHDLVFLDPPYGSGLGQKALAALSAEGWLAPGALIVWEDAAPQPAPQGFKPLDQRKFGQTHVTFLKAPAP